MNKKKKDILQAALREFSQKTFDEASVNEIITISNTSKGTFYHYFQDKTDLYTQLLKNATETKWNFIIAEMAKQNEPDPPTDIFDLFKQQALLGIQFAERYPEYHALGKRFSNEKENSIYSLVLEELVMAQNEESALEPLFSKAYQKGELNAQFTLEFIQRTVLFLFNHFDEIYIGPQASQDEILANLYSLIEFMRYGFSGALDKSS